MIQKRKSGTPFWRWSLLSLAVQATVASAASNEFLDMSLEELVDYRITSMSRKEQRVADVAAAAYVISAEEIRRSGAQSIPEALRLVPGLNVAQISRSRWAVSSRRALCLAASHPAWVKGLPTPSVQLRSMACWGMCGPDAGGPWCCGVRRGWARPRWSRA